MKTDLKTTLERRGYSCDLIQEVLDLFLAAERNTAIEFANHLDKLSPVNKVTVHPYLRTMSTDELFDKYKSTKV